MQINLNNYINVKLTDRGKQIHKEFYGQYATADFPYLSPDIDKDGYTKFQMHSFMLIYGQYMFMGNTQLPIEDMNVILI